MPERLDQQTDLARRLNAWPRVPATAWEPAMMNIQLTERADVEIAAASEEPSGEGAP